VSRGSCYDTYNAERCSCQCSAVATAQLQQQASVMCMISKFAACRRVYIGIVAAVTLSDLKKAC
jgi:hypothetical protein